MSNTPWYLDALKQGVEAAENMNIHPDLKQAAIDQGIRPAGYDASVAAWGQLSPDQLFDLYKGIHDQAAKDTAQKFLTFIREQTEEHEKNLGSGEWGDGGAWENGYLCALESMEHFVMPIAEGTE